MNRKSAESWARAVVAAVRVATKDKPTWVRQELGWERIAPHNQRATIDETEQTFVSFYNVIGMCLPMGWRIAVGVGDDDAVKGWTGVTVYRKVSA